LLVRFARRFLVLPKPLQWNHNDHYHPQLLEQIPAGASRALDVGCGTGAFARKLASRVARVDAIDRSVDALALACERSADVSNLRFVDSDLFSFEDDPRGYDFISLIAVIHHMDFTAAAARLRSLLAPGGVLAVLGIAREDTVLEYARSLAVVGMNGVVGAWFAARHSVGRPAPIPTGRSAAPEAPVRDPSMTFREVRAQAPEVFPGSSYRRLAFWRYLLTYRRPD
jgi:ubiquinone/menaquinone biosynthesis C-methylase UbiE